MQPIIFSRNLSIPQRAGIALGIVAAQALLIWLVWILFRGIGKKVSAYGERNFKPLVVKKYSLLSPEQITRVLLFLLKILKYFITAFQLYITIPMVFSLFSVTRDLASTLFGYVLNPLKEIGGAVLSYVPNLFTIVIILLIMRYVIRSLKFFSGQIEKGKVVFPGFYADWAQPTFNIVRALLYAFTLALIYPYLPGSGSSVFQGVSVFVGVIISLGSTSAVGNLVAGLVITYMRPFRIGDRIQIKDITGYVAEKSAMVTRVRTRNNEYVTFPNMMILTSSITNFSSSAEHHEGLLLHAEITIGYGVPWPKVHEILIAAAARTSNTEETPRPFVLQTALDNFSAKYQVNLYTKKPDLVLSIYSELYQHIRDGFSEAGIDMTTPHYEVIRKMA